MIPTTARNYVPFQNLAAQYEELKHELRPAIDAVLASQLCIGGPQVLAFEHAFAEYFGAAEAIAVSSGTDALLAVLWALGIGPGDCVITTDYSFVATASCISRLGATPVFADISLDTYCVSDDAFMQAVASAPGPVKAYIPVHLFGYTADTPRAYAYCREHNVAILEDVAQATGARHVGGKYAGLFGDAGCFSFFPSKNLGACGDGGAIVTDDTALARELRLIRNHGAEPRFYHQRIGGNFRLDAIQAAILAVKINKLSAWNEQRRAVAVRYWELLGNSLEIKESITLPTSLSPRSGAQHVFNQFVVLAKRREGLQQHLQKRGVETAVYYPQPFHKQRCFSDAVALARGGMAFPGADFCAEHALALPIYPELRAEQQDRVVAEIAAFYRG